LLVLAPLLLTDVPPLLDYPSHLGRLTVLAAADHDPVRQIWTANWSPIPNLAMDVVVLGMARLVPLHLAGKIFVAIALLMPALGAITLHRALYRRRSWWPVASFAVAYNGILLAGFLNFLLGLGLALLAAAQWVRWIERPAALRALAAAAPAIPIYFSHLTALVFFVTMVASIECWVALRRGRVEPARFAVVAMALLPLTFLAFAKPMTDIAPQAGWSSGFVALVSNPLERLRNLLTPFWTYDPLLDVAVLSTFVVFLSSAAHRGRLAMAPGLLLLAAAMLLAFPLFPTTVLGTGWVDRRIPMFAAFLLFACLDPGSYLAGLRARYIVLALSLAVTRIVLVGAVWAHWEANDRRDLLAVTSNVTPGQRVLVVRAQDRGHPRLIWQMPRNRQIMLDVDATIHWPDLPLAERPAFLPLLHTGHQPIEVAPAFACLARADGQPPHWRTLTDATADDLRNAPYLVDWQRRFDFVLLLQSGRVAEASDLLPGRLTPIIVRGAAALYRVIHQDSTIAAAPNCPSKAAQE
jgi:hypothetical protein